MKDWVDEEMDVNPPSEQPERRAASQRFRQEYCIGCGGFFNPTNAQAHANCGTGLEGFHIKGLPEGDKEAKLPPPIRKFETGATRSNNEGKLDYSRFNHALVDKVYAEYMHRHRKQEDGSLRAGDNWQKGWEKEVSLESLMRHITDIRLHLKGYPHEATEGLVESICASIFNLKAMLLQVLRENGRG